MRARMADIVFHAADLSGYTEEQVRGPGRVQYLARVRQAVCLIAREQVRKDGDWTVPAYSYPQIGAYLGGRDHSTIIHACQRAVEMAARDPDYARLVDALRRASADGRVFVKTPALVKAPPAPTPVLFRVQPKPQPVVRQWEQIAMAGDHHLRLDQDGFTMDDHSKRAGIIAGSRQLAEAIQQARVA